MTSKSAIDYAKEQLGVKYVYGGEDPGVEFDCSGLVQYSYGKAGIKLPRTAAQQQKATSTVSAKNAKPGDLVFFGKPATHVGIYLGNGEFLEAPHPGSVVKIAHFDMNAVTFGRVSGSDAAAGRSAAVANAQDPSTYQSYGYVATLASNVPEIKNVLNEAIKNGWSVDRFNDAIDTTQWWKKNSDTAKKAIALQAADPAEFTRQMNAAKTHVQQIADSLGVKLTASLVQSFATQDLYQGLDDATLSNQIGAKYTGLQTTAGGAAGGGLANQYADQIKQAAAAYGIPVTDKWVNGYILNSLRSGQQGITAAVADLKVQAKSMFPSLAAQIDAGQTVSDIAQPFTAQMANLLEVDPSTITLQDPTIQKALAGQLPSSTAAPAPKPGTKPGITAAPAAPAAPTTLYDFKNAVRNDPRWDQTDNAKAAGFQMSHDLLKSFGATAI